MKSKFALIALIVFVLAACTTPLVSPLPTPTPCPTCEVCEICAPTSDFGAVNFSAGNQDFARLIARSVVVKQDIEADTLYEYSDAAGVTIDGLTLKDGGIAESFTVAGGLEVTGNLTVSTLVSQSVGFNATGSSAFLTTTVTGPLSVTGAVNMDSTLDVDGNITSGTGAVTITDNVNVTGTVDFDSTLNVDGAATINGAVDIDGNISSGTGAVTVTDAVYITSTLETVGNITAGGTLTLESVAFSGPIRFGTASSVVSGTLIAHSLATTPTAVLLTPQSTGGYTTTVPYILASNATSFTVGIADSVTIVTLHWMAGK